MMCAPLRANRSEMARPIPRVPPVTTKVPRSSNGLFARDNRVTESC